MASYTPGQTVRLSATFDLGSTPTDPTTITVTVKDPTGAETTGTYAGGQVIRDGAGVYHYDLVPTLMGWWYWGFTGTGTVVASSEGSFACVTNLN